MKGIVIGLTVASLLALVKGNERLEDLEGDQEVVLQATVHLASLVNDDQLSLYLEIVNPYANTIACRGELVAIVERIDLDSKRLVIDSRRMVFNKLQVFPDRAFANGKLVYPITDTLPVGDRFSVDANYPQIMVTCRGWDFVARPLDPAFCQRNADAHDKICVGGVKRYPLLIEDYWLGTCSC